MKTLLLALLLSIGASAQSLTAPTITAATGDKITVSIAGGGDGLIAVQWVLYYDDDVIHAASDAVSNDPNKLNTWGCTAGGVIGNSLIFCNGAEPGIFRIAIINPYGFSGTGTLVDIPFTTTKGDTDLDLDDAQFYTNNGPINVKVTDGSVELH